MPGENSTTQARLTTEIVAAYIARNQVAADQLPSLISAVHQALGQLGEPVAEAVVDRIPAVSIRRSVHRDYVVCISCGYRGLMLRRHLTTAHGLTVEQYRALWNLPRDHAMTAPAYSERRSTVAKQLGLGRVGRRASGEATVVPEAETQTTQPGPKRRGRPRAPRS